jgi:hypothetical protein
VLQDSQPPELETIPSTLLPLLEQLDTLDLNNQPISSLPAQDHPNTTPSSKQTVEEGKLLEHIETPSIEDILCYFTSMIPETNPEASLAAGALPLVYSLDSTELLTTSCEQTNKSAPTLDSLLECIEEAMLTPILSPKTTGGRSVPVHIEETLMSNQRAISPRAYKQSSSSRITTSGSGVA